MRQSGTTRKLFLSNCPKKTSRIDVGRCTALAPSRSLSARLSKTVVRETRKRGRVRSKGAQLRGGFGDFALCLRVFATDRFVFLQRWVVCAPGARWLHSSHSRAVILARQAFCPIAWCGDSLSPLEAFFALLI
ncbi:hypothetical protein NDU88_000347 [Pleurodeles waltl]|uniref:Uncharacterized protein n=1 Tax=Pleurodeles waltl TaxID=8319 RepID=A0AAV7V6J4_PLEWA|nr:hypothetical protein NDU88_000347 [Pleurodeles waltl]